MVQGSGSIRGQGHQERQVRQRRRLGQARVCSRQPLRSRHLADLQGEVSWRIPGPRRSPQLSILPNLFRFLRPPLRLDKHTPPSLLFRRLRKRNPSPYGFLINLGEQEYLVGASPEMFVRVEEVANDDLGRKALRVETCPISGTVARGADALEVRKREERKTSGGD